MRSWTLKFFVCGLLPALSYWTIGLFFVCYSVFFLFRVKREDKLANQIFQLEIYSDTCIIQRGVAFSIHTKQKRDNINQTVRYELTLAKFCDDTYTTVQRPSSEIRYENNWESATFTIPPSIDTASGIYLVIKAKLQQQELTKSMLLTVE